MCFCEWGAKKEEASVIFFFKAASVIYDTASRPQASRVEKGPWLAPDNSIKSSADLLDLSADSICQCQQRQHPWNVECGSGPRKGYSDHRPPRPVLTTRGMFLYPFVMPVNLDEMKH